MQELMNWEELMNPENWMLSTESDGALCRSAFSVSSVIDKKGNEIGNKKLKLIVDKNVKILGSMRSMSNLVELILPKNLQIIKENTCGGSDWETITIPAGIIKENSFGGCRKLTNIQLGNKVTEIGSGAFASDSALTEITIPSSVNSIANDAFDNCDNLTKIILKKGSTLMAPDCKWGATNATIIRE